LLSTAIVLAIWTAIDPWTWNRKLINDFPPESYGKCSSNHFARYFAPLCGIMIVATTLAFGMAWKTKNLRIDSKFSDANAVLLAIASQLQAWFGKVATLHKPALLRARELALTNIAFLYDLQWVCLFWLYCKMRLSMALTLAECS
jgi:hypothetical protein